VFDAFHCGAWARMVSLTGGRRVSKCNRLFRLLMHHARAHGAMTSIITLPR